MAWNQVSYVLATLHTKCKEKAVVNQDNRPGIMRDLHGMHFSTSDKRFNHLGNCFLEKWRPTEPAYCEWLKKQYLTAPWNSWHVTASHIPGVLPNQNPIESHHLTIKLLSAGQLQAQTMTVLDTIIPNLLRHFGKERTPEVIRHYCAMDHVPSGTFAKAKILMKKDNHLAYSFGTTHRYVFNTNEHVVGAFKANELPVTTERVKAEKTLARTSLHTVRVDTLQTDIPENEDIILDEETILRIRKKFTCDCMPFFKLDGAVSMYTQLVV